MTDRRRWKRSDGLSNRYFFGIINRSFGCKAGEHLPFYVSKLYMVSVCASQKDEVSNVIRFIRVFFTLHWRLTLYSHMFFMLNESMGENEKEALLNQSAVACVETQHSLLFVMTVRAMC